MPKKRYKPKEIVAKLRQVDVHLSPGVSDVTYFSSPGGSFLVSSIYSSISCIQMIRAHSQLGVQ